MTQPSGGYRIKRNPRQKMGGFIKVLIIVSLLVIFGCIIYVMVRDQQPNNPNNPNNPPVTDVSMTDADISDVEGLSTDDQQSAETSDTPPSPPSGDLVEYNGPIEHIFVHPLVAYPELAFDGVGNAKDMDDVMTTATEFKRILEECYKNNFILVNIEKCFGFVEVDGEQVYQRLPLRLPEGKKPLIISTDDMNYYTYMIENGCNYKVVLDSDGNIAMYSKDPNGNDVVSYDTEVMPIVDTFVREHPDFSHEGAKGVVGLTGYDGVLGYRTDRDNTTTRESEIEAVKPVIERLKATGWTFASHSYGHLHMDQRSFADLKGDVDQFNEEVVPLIGKTEIFLYPYGERPMPDSLETKEKMDYLINVGGFRHFSGVGRQTYEINVGGRYVHDDRKNIDGMVLRNYGNQISALMDADYVIDLEARGSVPGQGIGVK